MSRLLVCRPFSFVTRHGTAVTSASALAPHPARRHYQASLSPRQQQHNYQHSPYAVLGIPANSSLDQVKRAFVKLALKTHPDQQRGSTEHFLRIRQAFESIQQSRHGKGGPNGWSSEELKEWWEEETGEFLSFSMNEDTRQEVIHAFHTMKPSGKDKGGYWEMARQLAERDALMKKHGKPPAEEDRPVAQLENSSVLNRRRRKR